MDNEDKDYIGTLVGSILCKINRSRIEQKHRYGVTALLNLLEILMLILIMLRVW